jgi:hypothetical protein
MTGHSPTFSTRSLPPYAVNDRSASDATVEPKRFNSGTRAVNDTAERKPFSSGTLRSLTIVMSLLLAANVAGAQDAPDTVTTRLADGSAVVGPLQSVSAGEIRLAGRTAPIAAADVIRLDFHDRRRVPAPRASLIQLVNGDRIVAGLTSMSDEAVVALWKSHPDWPPVRIPSETIAGILMTAPSGALQVSRGFSQVFGRRQKTDIVLLLNGDRAAGDLQSFDQAGLKLAQEGKPLQIELAHVRGVAFNSSLSSLPAAKKPRIHVTLTDGSQLTGSGAARDGEGPLRFTTAFGSPLEVPLSAILSLRFLDGRTTYLSDLEPQETRLTGFFGASERLAFAKDQNLIGGPLVVRGTEYPKGLGTRSQSQIAFDLAGRYRRFQALAALDDLAQGKGSARFVVERDGSRAFESELLTGTNAPVVVGPLDVTGARRLVLIVEYGELADIDDWADWCDAVVIR